ncbi:outer membrane lipoprotein-sorting protein [Vibrio sp. WJH972]
MKKIVQLVTAVTTIALSSSALALTADEIMQNVDAFPEPDSLTSKMSMVLVDNKGKQRIRSLTTSRKKFGDDEKSLMFFLEPSDVKGTGFLMVDYGEAVKDDDQWMLLPSLKKTKRIASADKTSSFMGSDFSYADMNDRNLEEWNYKIIKEDQVNGASVWIIESLPVSDEIIDKYGYTRSIIYVKQDNFQVVRGISYKKKKGEIKLLNIAKSEFINGYWINLETQMITQKNGKTVHRTLMKVDDVDVGPALDDGEFTLNRLERGL